MVNAKKKTKKKIVKPKYRQRVLFEMIHDRSGSMRETWDENLSGFDVFVQDLVKDNSVDQFLSLTVFDTLVDRPLHCKPLSQVNPYILSHYPPRGMTSLYDAVGNSLEALKAIESDFDKIVVVIITDGQENASRIFNKATINDAIDKALAKGKYTFTYLGTQPETWNDASAIGMPSGNTVRYDSELHAGSTYSIAAQALNGFKTSKMRFTRSLYADHGDAKAMLGANFEVAKDK